MPFYSQSRKLDDRGNAGGRSIALGLQHLRDCPWRTAAVNGAAFLCQDATILATLPGSVFIGVVPRTAHNSGSVSQPNAPKNGLVRAATLGLWLPRANLPTPHPVAIMCSLITCQSKRFCGLRTARCRPTTRAKRTGARGCSTFSIVPLLTTTGSSA